MTSNNHRNASFWVTSITGNQALTTDSANVRNELSQFLDWASEIVSSKGQNNMLSNTFWQVSAEDGMQKSAKKAFAQTTSELAIMLNNFAYQAKFNEKNYLKIEELFAMIINQLGSMQEVQQKYLAIALEEVKQFEFKGGEGLDEDEQMSSHLEQVIRFVSLKTDRFRTALETIHDVFRAKFREKNYASGLQ